jgi:hypothetical protein
MRGASIEMIVEALLNCHSTWERADTYSDREILVGRVPSSCRVIQLVPAQLNPLRLSHVQLKYFATETRSIRNTIQITSKCSTQRVPK